MFDAHVEGELTFLKTQVEHTHLLQKKIWFHSNNMFHSFHLLNHIDNISMQLIQIYFIEHFHRANQYKLKRTFKLIRLVTVAEE